MQQITVKKDGIYFSFWDESSTSWIDKTIDKVDLPITWYLPYFVQVEENVSIHDFLMQLKPYLDDLQLIFVNALGNVKLSEVYEILEAIKPDPIKMDGVYLVKIGESSPIEDDVPLLNIYTALMGIRTDESENDVEVIYLSSYDINSWCDLPFSIDQFAEFTDITNENIVFEGYLSWQFFEVIAAILSQLTISVQVTKSIQVKENNNTASGPMTLEELFVWFDELDRILLLK